MESNILTLQVKKVSTGMYTSLCGRLIKWSPQAVQTLIPGTCEYINVDSIGDFRSD